MGRIIFQTYAHKKKTRKNVSTVNRQILGKNFVANLSTLNRLHEIIDIKHNLNIIYKKPPLFSSLFYFHLFIAKKTLLFRFRFH